MGIMMKGIVCIEGGGTPHIPDIEQPFVGLESGAEMIQNALYRLFEQEIPNLNTLFYICPVGGFSQATAAFAKSVFANPQIAVRLVVDYQDIIGATRQDKISTLFEWIAQEIIKGKLPDINIPVDNFRDAVFFMIQKMESWILSQPEVIIREYQHLKHHPKLEGKLSELQSREITTLLHPDDILSTLIGYFEEEKKGKLQKVKYHKIRTSSILLPKLSLVRLMQDFQDVQRLVDEIRLISDQ
jgi:hypothetical protein